MSNVHKFTDEVIDLGLALNQEEIINLAVDHGLLVPRGIACKENRPCNCMFMCEKERGYERTYPPPSMGLTLAENNTKYGISSGKVIPVAPVPPSPRIQSTKMSCGELITITVLLLSIILLSIFGPGEF